VSIYKDNVIGILKKLLPINRWKFFFKFLPTLLKLFLNLIRVKNTSFLLWELQYDSLRIFGIKIINALILLVNGNISVKYYSKDFPSVHPRLYLEIYICNSMICDQRNYWIRGFKHSVKHMNQYRFNFFFYKSFDYYNEIKSKGIVNIDNSKNLEKLLPKKDSDDEDM